ncbi:MAG: esterase-like activity of phytase family protein [Gemmatimonas sp.]
MPLALTRRTLLAAFVLLASLALGLPLWPAEAADQGPDIRGIVSHGLVGVGRIAASQRDKFGETFGSGSGMAVDRSAWRRDGDGYSGTIWLLPDRGYNVEGTNDYRPRLNRLSIAFTPGRGNGQDQIVARLTDTLLLTDPTGAATTGLDPGQGGVRPATNGFPELPQAANGRLALDTEAVVRLPDGGWFIGDEYGPHIYRFSAEGRMLAAIRPPEALIPLRHGKTDFSSNNPGPGAKPPSPKDPEFGRPNNQGVEGLTLTPDGRTLVAILQSATRQDGGTSPETRRYTRILFYDVSDLSRPRLVREHVVPLPVFTGADGKQKVAAQSELLALGDDLFLLLCRDGGAGYGLKDPTSRYRRIELLDTSKATNIAGTDYDRRTPVAPNGQLAAGVTPATLRPFIDLNDNAELGKFGLHNGAPNDRDDLTEKWEAMGLLPALDPAAPDDWFLFIANDNDFITQDGFQAGEAYKDPSGLDLDTMLLAYRVTLPGYRGR